MNRLLFIVLAFMMFSQPVIAQITYEENIFVKRMREQHDQQQKRKYQFQKPVDDSVLTVLGRWARGPCLAVDIQGDYAYVGNGPTLQILDIHDPAHPIIAGEYLCDGWIQELFIKGSLLYVSANGYLLILNVSNPNQPVLVGSVDASCWRLAVSDSFAYALTWGCYLQIIDISNPASPYLRGGVMVIGDELPTNVVVNGKTVYANGDQGYGFSMVDVTDPDHPQSYASPLESFVTGMATKDTILLVCTRYDSLIIYSVSNPLQPFELSRIKIDHGPVWIGMTIDENIVYATTLFRGDQGVYVIDISDPSNPFERDFFSMSNSTHWYYKIRKWNGVLITAVESGMMLIDAQNPDSLKQTSFFATAQDYKDIKIKNNFAFIACGLSGLWILDISNPYDPLQISNVNTGSYALEITLNDSFVYMICRNPYIANDTSRGLYIINYSDKYKPFVCNHYFGTIKNFTQGVYVPNSITYHKKKVFITQYIYNCDSLMEIIDVSNPYQILTLGILRGNFQARHVLATDSILYLGSYNGGMKIVNYSNPNLPFIMNSLFSNKYIYSICYQDTVLCTIVEDSLNIFNISNPGSPIILSSSKVQGFDINITGNYLYIGGASIEGIDASLGVFDITDRTNPVPVSFYVGIDNAQAVGSDSNLVLLAEFNRGVLVFKNNLIIDIKENPVPVIYDFLLYPNYPNPFNSSTNIRLFIKNRGIIELDLFNILGQKISTIFKGIKGCGFHEFYVNFNDLASGIYIVRLKTPWGKVSRKVLFVK